MERFGEIDDKIMAGYDFMLEKNDYPRACDIWLKAWEEIKELFEEGIAEDILDLNDKYKWTHYPSNYVQDVEAELPNADDGDGVYHKKRIAFCQELLQWCKDEIISSNARIGLAEGYFATGDAVSGERVFTEWLQDDPDNGWCYIGWADCYRMGLGDGQLEKAEEILLTGYARDRVREKETIGERLFLVYREMGKPDKAEEYREYCHDLPEVKPQEGDYRADGSVRVVKIGRNEPCPCGSGKKYKKCCGA